MQPVKNLFHNVTFVQFRMEMKLGGTMSFQKNISLPVSMSGQIQFTLPF